MSDQATVKQYMATDLITFKPQDDIREAIKTILKYKISGAPVVDKGGQLVGMLSESDCIKTIIGGSYNNQPDSKGSVSDYMTRNVTTISVDTSIMDLAFKFTTTAFRRFPVISKGRLVGQISRSDVLKAILKMKPRVEHTPSSWKGREPH